MSQNRLKVYSDNSGLLLIKELFEEGHYIFRVEEAKKIGRKYNISDTYTIELLHLLTKDGWITRLYRGLYALKEGYPGNIQLHPFAIASELVKPSAISHRSAMNYHGLTEQIPVDVTAMTTKKIVTPDMRKDKIPRNNQKHAWNISGIRYEYITVRPKYYFGLEEVWINHNFKVLITDKERTMVEGFASPGFFGGMGEIIGILEEHLTEFNMDRLISYGVSYGKSSVAKRLGWALEYMGLPRKVLLPLSEISVSGYRILDPLKPARGHCDKYWKIQVNLQERIRI